MKSIYFDEDDLKVASETEKDILQKAKEITKNLQEKAESQKEIEEERERERYNSAVEELKKDNEYGDWFDLSDKIAKMHLEIMKLTNQQHILERKLTEKHHLGENETGFTHRYGVHYRYYAPDPFPHHSFDLWENHYFRKKYRKKDLPPLSVYHNKLRESAKASILFDMSEKMKHKEIIKHETYEDRVCSKKIQEYINRNIDIEGSNTAK